jgi:FlaA1/EpsC-like NDP-sugar epimerase/lipopolysaccharide/colanic/teichoic acid biosynthesis glycosyltransferase
MIKRFIDIIVAMAGLLFFFPLLIFIYCLLRLSYKGPAIIRDIRIGKNQKEIYLLKFQVYQSVIHKDPYQSNDKKETKFSRYGKILHLIGMDGLPLLFNVLKGDLSLVGPPAEVPKYVRYYKEEQKEVFSVRPGLWWPYNEELTCPKQNKLSWENHYKKNILPEKIKRELSYTKDKGIGCDIRLLANFLRNALYKTINDRFIKEAQTHNYFLPIDILLILFSYIIAYLLRFELHIPQHEFIIFLKSITIVLFTRIITFYVFGIYKNLWKYVGVRDLLTIVLACTVSSVIIISTLYVFGIVGHSRSIFFIDWLLCIALIGASRLSLRLLSENSGPEQKFRQNVLIIGAGDVGDMALRMLQFDCQHTYHVIGFIDNDCAIQGKTIHGLKVLGTYEDIPELVSIFRVDEVLIAVPEISSEEMKTILKYCKESNVRHRIVPAVNDLLSGSVHLSKFRKVEIADLFGRQPVKLDLTAISELIKGKRVLVTGAGGSIGSELCRHISELHPKCLILVDKNENYLHEIRCELESQFESLSLYCSLCSITNRKKLRMVFFKNKPEIVFHAAANKHVPLSDENPEEAVWNNVFGTKVLANIADEFGVQQFVMISTDKAVNPTSVMGATKRIAECYIQSLSQHSKTKYVTVRFGNVLNSNGSVIPIFRKQIEKGGPLTITHPDMERYFMSISEAVQLILQTVTIGKTGEIFVLEMGKSIRIMDMAVDLISQAGFKPFEDIPIKITGLRPGEKKFEELVGCDEKRVPTSHANIKILKSNHQESFYKIERKLENLINIEILEDRERLISKLQELVPEYSPDTVKDDHIYTESKVQEFVYKMSLTRNKRLISMDR